MNPLDAVAVNIKSASSNHLSGKTGLPHLGNTPQFLERVLESDLFSKKLLWLNLSIFSYKSKALDCYPRLH